MNARVSGHWVSDRHQRLRILRLDIR